MIIKTSGLACGYNGASLTEEIGITFESGQVSGILGPNGVGKTTFFKTLLGYLKPVAGKVEIDGRDLGQWQRRDLAKKIAYVPQARSQPFAYSAYSMVLMGRAVYLKSFSSPGKKDHEICRRTMERLGIAHLASKNYSQLSGGEQQMVLIVRALVQEPAFLMMDEPTSNLDYGNQVQVMKQILRLKEQGIGIVMITHSPEHAFLCSDQVALFYRNGKVRIGLTKSVLTQSGLREAYGIKVKVMDVVGDDNDRTTVCVPFLN